MLNVNVKTKTHLVKLQIPIKINLAVDFFSRMFRFRNCSLLFESKITQCPVHSVHKYPEWTLVTQPADNSGAWRDLYHWVSHSVIHIQALNVTKCHIKASLLFLSRLQYILRYCLNPSVRQKWNCVKTQASLWPTRTVSYWELWEDVGEINSKLISLQETEDEAGPGDYVGGMRAKQHCLLVLLYLEIKKTLPSSTAALHT